jgi:hypothetical protein
VLTGGGETNVNNAMYPVLLLRDANGRLAQVRGASFQMEDLTPPVIADYAVVQLPGEYVFRPSAGRVSDNSSGNLSIYHFRTPR